MDKTTKIIIGIIVVAAIIWGGYALMGKPAQTNAETIKIGLSASLTGEAASYGESVLAATQVAVKEINDAGGINGKKIELIVEDDKCEPTAAVNAVTKLVNTDKVVAVLGPLCSAAAGPALPITQKAGLINMLYSASAPALIKTGEYVFRNYPSDTFQGKFAAEYMVNVMQKKNIAVVYVKNDWGVGIRDVFSARLKELGGTVVFEESITQDAKDARTTLAKLKATNPDAIFLPIYPANANVVLRQIQEAGIKAPIVGGDAMGGTESFTAKGAEGVMYVQPRTNNPQEFQDKVKAAGSKDVSFLAPYAYDALKVLALAIKNAGSTDSNAIKAELLKIKYTTSVAVPVVEFGADRELKTAEYDMMVIKNQAGVKVQ